RAVWAVVKSNDDVRSPAPNIFIDRLANARLEAGQIAPQIDYDIALLSIHRIEFDAKLCSVVMDLGAAVTSHASHNRSASRKRREITNRNKRRNLYCFLSYESAPAAKRGECARATSALAANGASRCDCRGRWVGLSASVSCRFCLGRKACARRGSRIRRFPGFFPAGVAVKHAGGVFACGVVALRMVALRECNKREPPP